MFLAKTVLVFILTLTLLFPSSSVLAQEKVDVYALFWPVVPGTTIADSMFWAKQLKEAFGGFFKSGNIDQSGYQIELSEKRLVEANKLVEDKDYSNALKSLKLNKSHRDEAVRLLKQAREEEEDANELTGKISKSLEKQKDALAYIASQLPEDEKKQVNEMVVALILQISEAK
jgi:hypothetical protein